MHENREPTTLPISEIDFFNKARFHMPTREHTDLFRKALLERFNDFGLDDMLAESADLLCKAWPGASDKQLLLKMMDMVTYTDNLPKVGQPVGAIRRAVLRSPADISAAARPLEFWGITTINELTAVPRGPIGARTKAERPSVSMVFCSHDRYAAETGTAQSTIWRLDR